MATVHVISGGGVKVVGGEQGKKGHALTLQLLPVSVGLHPLPPEQRNECQEYGCQIEISEWPVGLSTHKKRIDQS